VHTRKAEASPAIPPSGHESFPQIFRAQLSACVIFFIHEKPVFWRQANWV
jgi:hypothetical protein